MQFNTPLGEQQTFRKNEEDAVHICRPLQVLFLQRREMRLHLLYS